MANPTTNFGWVLPVVGASSGVWGTILNDMFEVQDTDLQAVSDAAMPLAGGAFTDEIEIHTFKYVDGALSTSGTVTMDLSTAQSFTITPSGTVTFAFSNVPATGDVVPLTMFLTNGGAQTINWPASVNWPGGTEPTWTAAGVDIITGVTIDGGTTWHLARAIEDSS